MPRGPRCRTDRREPDAGAPRDEEVLARTPRTLRLSGVLLAVVPLLFAVACSDTASNASGGGAALEGTTWVLDAASMGSLADTVPDGARVDLLFDADRAGGRAACNQYSGGYTVDGESLAFEAFAVTQMACDEPLMQLETAYLAALGQVDGFQVTNSGLVLTGGNVALTYTAEAAPEALALTGTRWAVTTIATGTDAVSSTVAGTEPFLVFAEDGSVSGNDGCNDLNGPYEAGEDGSLSIGPLAGTMKACEPDIGQQSAEIGQALTDTASYTIEGASLTLQDGDGKLVLGLEGTAS